MLTMMISDTKENLILLDIKMTNFICIMNNINNKIGVSLI